jgi:hypothetical protein
VTQECRRLNLWTPFRSAGIEALPLVVLWGHGVRGWSEGERVRIVEGVAVVSGHTLRDWMRERRAQALDPAQVKLVLDAVTAQVERRDRADRERAPMPRSAGEILSAVGQVIAGCAFGLVACVYALSGFGLGWGSAGGLLIATLSLVPLTMGWGRRFAQGWLIGAGLPALVAALAVVTERLF